MWSNCSDPPADLLTARTINKTGENWIMAKKGVLCLKMNTKYFGYSFRLISLGIP